VYHRGQRVKNTSRENEGWEEEENLTSRNGQDARGGKEKNTSNEKEKGSG
jgi:hypothetical protein